jgi:hypothetical protein
VWSCDSWVVPRVSLSSAVACVGALSLILASECAGSKLLQKTLDQCKEDSNIVEVYLHVQTNNDAAVAFYRKYDFVITDKIQNYYKHIEPPDCFVLSKVLISGA